MTKTSFLDEISVTPAGRQAIRQARELRGILAAMVEQGQSAAQIEHVRERGKAGILADVVATNAAQRQALVGKVEQARAVWIDRSRMRLTDELRAAEAFRLRLQAMDETELRAEIETAKAGAKLTIFEADILQAETKKAGLADEHSELRAALKDRNYDTPWLNVPTIAEAQKLAAFIDANGATALAATVDGGLVGFDVGDVLDMVNAEGEGGESE